MSAPSFSSFPPTFSSFPDLDPGPSTRPASSSRDDKESEKSKEKERRHHKKSKREADRDGDGDSERKKKKHKHREREDSTGARRRSRPRSRSRTRHDGHDYDYTAIDDERRKLEEDRRHREEETVRPSAREGLVYYTDRKGDPLNVRYGGLYAGDVPKYRLVDWGRKVLGLSPALSVVHRGRGGVEVAPFGRRRMPTLTDSHSRRLLAAEPKRRLLASSDDKYKYSEVDGFLRISTNRPRTDDQRYREIELSKQDYDSNESDVSEESASSEDDTGTTPTTARQAAIVSLRAKLDANPQDIPSWLALHAHNTATVLITQKNASAARADIGLSVLADALKAHPNNARSKTLRLKYLRAGEERWEPSKLSREWEEAVKVDDVEIWLAWLDWRIRTVDENVDDISERLAGDATRAIKALARRGDEVGQLRVMWRVAVALRDAGYVERANAIFQAQAEMLFCMPPKLSERSLDDQLDALDEFWDSDVPRLGEPGASGWAAWEASGRPAQPPPPSKRGEAEPRGSDLYSQWAASETLADRTRTLSLRSVEEDENADPLTVVILPDIRPFLLSLRTRRAKDVFRRIWLAFVGLQVPGFVASLSERPEDNTDDRWACSHLVSPSYLASVFPADGAAKRITADAQAGVLVGREREYGSGFGPVKNWGYETIAPLDVLGSSKWTMWTSEDVRGVDAGLVRGIFRHCRLGADDADWDVLSLAFEAAINLKSAVKVSKALLANARESLPHWAAHARLECLRGRLDDARKVYQTILIASHQSRPGAGALWWDWAQMEWLARNADVAQQVIIRASGVAGSGGIALLRAKRHFESLLTQELLQAPWREREPWIKIAGLLELLTSSSPHSALALLDSYLDALQPGTPAHESLSVAALALLYNHAAILKNPTPPALLRERVERAVEVYPSNTAIMGMFLEAEKGQGIWGRVRAMLGETTSEGTGKEKGVARRVAEVWVANWEKGRWEAEVERVRNGLAAAVEDDRTRGSAILWKLYVAFEIRAGQLERAKKLVYRAITECSLVKELYLLAFGPLRTVFEARELNQFGDTMSERGIRMRVALDEVVGEVEDGSKVKAEVDSEDEDEGDEIEHNARELRRLMPFS
ncbi:NRDE-2, necessary for RNA interference-domain-containing protein [Cerioporus squamosus]|nr:NRDE-2, necessary for RNA interference-domain-containing protein [Cerioporus squamosus]